MCWKNHRQIEEKRENKGIVNNNSYHLLSTWREADTAQDT